LQGFEYIRKIEKTNSGVTGPKPRSAQLHSACAAHDVSARDGAGAMLPYGGDLTGARETARKAWRGSPARGWRCGTTPHRRLQTGRRRGFRQRRVRTAAWVNALGQRHGTARRAVRSDSGCPNGAVGAAFKPPGAFGHHRPQQPIRAWHGATLPPNLGQFL
jgi:hypothetical protein